MSGHWAGPLGYFRRHCGGVLGARARAAKSKISNLRGPISFVFTIRNTSPVRWMRQQDARLNVRCTLHRTASWCVDAVLSLLSVSFRLLFFFHPFALCLVTRKKSQRAAFRLLLSFLQKNSSAPCTPPIRTVCFQHAHIYTHLPYGPDRALGWSSAMSMTVVPLDGFLSARSSKNRLRVCHISIVYGCGVVRWIFHFNTLCVHEWTKSAVPLIQAEMS